MRGRGWERSLAVRGLLLLSVVGAVLYGLLLLSDKVRPPGETETTAAEKAQVNSSADRALRSWGRTLPALVIKPPSDDRLRRSDKWPVMNDQFNVSAQKSAETKDETAEPETAKIALAARMHSEPLVSSPTVRFFSPGTELQLVRRQNGWVELIDPATRMRGWVLESYVTSIYGPGSAQVAMGSPAEEQLSKSKPAKPLSRSKQQSRSVKPMPQATDKFAAKLEQRRGRWARHDERRRRFGLFGRRFATFDNTQ